MENYQDNKWQSIARNIKKKLKIMVGSIFKFWVLAELVTSGLMSHPHLLKVQQDLYTFIDLQEKMQLINSMA